MTSTILPGKGNRRLRQVLRAARFPGSAVVASVAVLAAVLPGAAASSPHRANGQQEAITNQAATAVSGGTLTGALASTAQPANDSENDSKAVELGLRFEVVRAGSVEGVRFYKSTRNTGTHTGSLWDNSGNLLARLTFSNESASGWQTATFAKPVALQVGKRYVISYHTNSGYYADDQHSFGSVDASAALRPLVGVYAYGAGSFPRDTWNASNYYVDAVFRVAPSLGAQAPSPAVSTSSKPAPAPTKSASPAPIASPSPSSTTASPTQAPSSPTSSPTNAPPSPTQSPTQSPSPTKSPSPSPTTSPAPSPAPTTGWPTASSTGVQPGVALTVHSGDLTISTAGAVVSGLDVRGCVTVTATNVTIRNVKVTGSCDNLIQNNSTGLVIDHVTLVGGGADSEGIGWSDFTVTNANISNVGDGIRANGNVVVRDSYIHGLVSSGGSHNDGIQVTDGSNITIERNAIENPNSQTSAIMLGADQGSISNILVQDNLLNGGGFALYGGAQPPSGNTISNIRLLNNVFGKLFYVNCGQYGPMTATNDSRITVSGNVWQGTNTAVS